MVMGRIARLKRMLIHAWHEAVSSPYPLPYATLDRLGAYVGHCERGHSGEIRIYIETALPWADLKQNLSTQDLSRQRAIELFGTQRVWDTAQNNGVLIYLLLAEHAIEIIADRGISQRVDAAVWQDLMARLSERCREGEIEAGLMQALSDLSALLVQHFPLREGELNQNELADFPALGH
jgi:uncharacterized membrane protein